MTFEEMKNLSEEEQLNLYLNLKKIRQQYKTTNYCLPNGTKVLTSNGWENIEDIKETSCVLSYNTCSEKVEPDKIIKLHKYENSDIITYGNSRSEFSCTPNHRWYVSKRVRSEGVTKFVKKYVESKDLNQECNIILSASYIGGDSNITSDEAFFIGLLLSDGYYKWSDNLGGTSNSFGNKRGIICSIAQSKLTGYIEVENNLQKLGLSYVRDVSNRANGNDVYIYRLKAHEIRPLLRRIMGGEFQKHAYNWSKWVISLSFESMKSFYNGFYLGDGALKGVHTGVYQNVGNIFDAIVIATQLLGAGRVTINKTSGGNRYKFIRRHSINHMTCQRLHEIEKSVGDVYCLTTGNGNFIIWQGDFVGITGNSATYGVGAAKLARELKSTTAIAKGLLNAYWNLNWAIKAFADDCKVIYYGKEMWVQNPLNGFYYNLRAKKDVFSTVNQSTGTYCFDIWLYYILQKCKSLVGQFHDEFILDIKKGDEEKTKRIIKNSMDKVNKKLSLNVELGFDVKFGENYARIH